jgi:hypothetical protein
VDVFAGCLQIVEAKFQILYSTSAPALRARRGKSRASADFIGEVSTEDNSSIFPGTVPTKTVTHDSEEIGGSAVASPYQYTFKLKSMAPTKTSKGGEVRIVDSRISVAKNREFSSYAGKEKGRLARTAKQADSVDHDARKRKAAVVDDLSAQTIRHIQR